MLGFILTVKVHTKQLEHLGHQKSLHLTPKRKIYLFMQIRLQIGQSKKSAQPVLFGIGYWNVVLVSQPADHLRCCKLSGKCLNCHCLPGKSRVVIA